MLQTATAAGGAIMAPSTGAELPAVISACGKRGWVFGWGAATFVEPSIRHDWLPWRPRTYLRRRLSLHRGN